MAKKTNIEKETVAINAPVIEEVTKPEDTVAVECTDTMEPEMRVDAPIIEEVTNPEETVAVECTEIASEKSTAMGATEANNDDIESAKEDVPQKHQNTIFQGYLPGWNGMEY